MQFEIKALREGNSVVQLTLDATDEREALQQVMTQGYTVLAIKSWKNLAGLLGKRHTHFPLVLFSQELLALLDAGLNLVEAVETLAEKEQRPETRKVLDRLIASLYEGQTFSAALLRFPEAFPALYVSTVKASEKTGGLSEAITRYVAYQAQLDVVRKKLVSASIYPVVLIVVGGLVTLFLMVYVVPKFSHIYEDMGGDLPFMSRMLIEWGKLLEAHGGAMLLGVVGLLAIIVFVLTRIETKRWIGEKLWLVPVIGEHMKIYQLARFYRTVGMLLRGGIPVVTALDMVSGLLATALRNSLDGAIQGVSEGRPLSAAMEEYALTTPVSSRMLRVGERTGNMGDMLERIAAFYDEEMARWVDWFTKLFEPLLMAVIGLIIGLIVVLMYMPIFELAGSIQ
ncbi:type II secretion system F family protein [Sulfurirhabdus autotrophica]|uniref:General secretion pathway protein F n=1 Tax=Sulfurirhabdus autotrophica TaxID=1706046 RepID=A0A4V2W2V9_9PROT|nr:type II secretion system F family protein [Sulfurirhabdus autotrophica]TCV89539.1 general secretion pathway protein F [Sulfurirhabdus autotrophica]